MYASLEYLDLAGFIETRRMYRTRFVQWLYSSIDLFVYIQIMLESCFYLIRNHELTNFNSKLRKQIFDELTTDIEIYNMFSSIYIQYIDFYNLRDDTFGPYQTKYIRTSLNIMFLVSSKIQYIISKYNNPLTLYTQTLQYCIDVYDRTQINLCESVRLHSRILYAHTMTNINYKMMYYSITALDNKMILNKDIVISRAASNLFTFDYMKRNFNDVECNLKCRINELRYLRFITKILENVRRSNDVSLEYISRYECKSVLNNLMLMQAYKYAYGSSSIGSREFFRRQQQLVPNYYLSFEQLARQHEHIISLIECDDEPMIFSILSEEIHKHARKSSHDLFIDIYKYFDQLF